MSRRNRTEGRRVAPMWLAGLAVLCLCFVAADLSAEQVEDPVGSENAKSALMAGRGRVTFRAFCGSCHGATAKGDGIVAPYLDPPPANLTEISMRYGGEFPTETIYDVIDGQKTVKGHGSRDMPVWGDIFRNPISSSSIEPDEGESERAHRKVSELVEYLRSLQTKSEMP